MQWKAGLSVANDEAGSPLQQRLRAVEEAPGWEIEDGGAEPPRPPRLVRRLGRVGMRPPPIPPQMDMLPARELSALCLRRAEQDIDDDDDGDDVDSDEVIPRLLQSAQPRLPQRGEWLWICWRWLDGLRYRFQLRRRRPRRLPRVCAAQQARRPTT